MDSKNIQKTFCWTCFIALLIIVSSCGNNSGWDDSKDFSKESSKNTLKPIKDLMPSRDLSIDRLIWQKPDEVIKHLGDVSDKTIVDLGAGSGYFSFRILPLAKKVIAIDIDPAAIQFLNTSRINLLSDELKDKLEPRLAQPNDPLLKKDEADEIIIVNTYMYLTNRIAYLKKLKNGLKNNGHVLIIDYKKRNIPIGPDSDSKIALSTVENELFKAGFTNIQSDDKSLEYQYIIKAQNNK